MYNVKKETQFHFLNNDRSWSIFWDQNLRGGQMIYVKKSWYNHMIRISDVIKSVLKLPEIQYA